MNILIVDDEPLARTRLRRLLIEQNWPLHSEASNATEALALVNKSLPDLVFLDVDMPGISGLEVASELNKLPIAPAIIFVTAHPEHALEALQLNAAGYLVKPVSAANLQKVLAQIGRLNKVQLQKQQLTKISYQLAGTLKTIDLESVYYFSAEEKYTKMVFKGGTALIEQSLKQLEALYPTQLLRIHRNTLINKHQLVALHTQANGSHSVELMHCGEQLAVSRRELKTVKMAL
ncbi:LytR/AlgR family response regulator transcription factor [Pseudoalteromonas sp.]|uniref:LytR/AlgR family response regulator transcription factor n=1 Tax=Pseudoalteromonas sp. TaxID=53249 RepID=UPI00356520F8